MNLFATAMIAVITLTTAAFGDSVENPVFKSWAGQKIGTSVSFKNTEESVSATGSPRTETTSVYTLVALTADEATLEIKTVRNAKALTKKLIVKKMIEAAGKAKDPENTTQGEDTLKIDGVEYKTSWTKRVFKSSEFESEETIWKSNEVPNYVVKELKKYTSKELTSHSMTELMSVKKP